MNSPTTSTEQILATAERLLHLGGSRAGICFQMAHYLLCVFSWSFSRSAAERRQPYPSLVRFNCPLRSCRATDPIGPDSRTATNGNWIAKIARVRRFQIDPVACVTPAKIRPQRANSQPLCEFSFVSESIIHHCVTGCTSVVEGQLSDHQRSGNNGLARHKSPEAGILAVIAVVAEDKYSPRHHQLAIMSRVASGATNLDRLQGQCRFWRESIADSLGGAKTEGRIGLVERNIVYEDSAIGNAKTFTRKSNNSFHQHGQAACRKTMSPRVTGR